MHAPPLPKHGCPISKRCSRTSGSNGTAGSSRRNGWRHSRSRISERNPRRRSLSHGGDGCEPRRATSSFYPPAWTLVGLKENQRINPMQSKLPRQRVSHHPAEVHACPTVHSAPCTTRYLGLTHRSVSHSRTPASRSSGGFMIPTTPCPPECMWTCRTSTVCLLPRRITVEGLDHVILKPTKFDRVLAVNGA